MGCFIFLSLCIGRLLFIQVFRSTYLAEIAKKQHNLFVELEPVRGIIYDTNLKPLAVNIPADSLYASPVLIADKEKTAAVLSNILNVDIDFLRQRLSRKKSFVWLARKVSPEQSAAVSKLNIKGLGFIRESRRSYPNQYLASQIMGFAGLDNTGLEGLEMTFDRYLKGEPGWGVFLRDARQKKLDIWEKMALPKDGYSLVLTIDEVIQYIAERELDKAFKAFRAKGATIIVMDPYTGAILALANRPTYDPNQQTNSNKDQIRNRAVCDMFEPGSVFKIVAASAAIEEKLISEEDKFYCENGSWNAGPQILHDHKPHGWLTFSEVIGQSSNIGTAKAAKILGPEIIYRYVKLFGFGVKTGVDMPGEVSGVIREPRFWSKNSLLAVPMGQEVGVTAMQLASAISAIANGGELMRPYIVKEVRDKYGEIIKEFSPVEVRKVISAETAERVKNILRGVVDTGTGTLAKIDGMSAGGKTGTAQKLEPNGRYSHNKFIGSFIGFAPAEDPAVAVVVLLDEPHPYYGGVVSAPVFKNVARDAIKYLNMKQQSRIVFNAD